MTELLKPPQVQQYCGAESSLYYSYFVQGMKEDQYANMSTYILWGSQSLIYEQRSHWKQLEFTKWSLESFANTWTLCVKPCRVLRAKALKNQTRSWRTRFLLCPAQCISKGLVLKLIWVPVHSLSGGAKGTLGWVSDVIISPFWNKRAENRQNESESWMRYAGLRNIYDLFLM